MSLNPSPSPGFKEQVSSTISRNFPSWTVFLSRQVSGMAKAVWNFLVEMLHDALGR